MRFLCLHGRGTNEKIFEMQTARIRQALDGHEFIFANGSVPTDPDAGAATVTDEYYGYFGNNVSQYRELCDDLIDLVKTQGPFDGLMGFSEGGTVAAFMLTEDKRRPFGDFKCAIFFSAGPPPDPDAVRSGIIRHVDPVTDGVVLEIPTAHIWSDIVEIDSVRAHRPLAQLCDEELRQEFIHDLGHDVPGSKLTRGLEGALRAIEHTIETAKFRSTN